MGQIAPIHLPPGRLAVRIHHRHFDLNSPDGFFASVEDMAVQTLRANRARTFDPHQGEFGGIQFGHTWRRDFGRHPCGRFGGRASQKETDQQNHGDEAHGADRADDDRRTHDRRFNDRGTTRRAEPGRQRIGCPASHAPLGANIRSGLVLHGHALEPGSWRIVPPYSIPAMDLPPKPDDIALSASHNHDPSPFPRLPQPPSLDYAATRIGAAPVGKHVARRSLPTAA